MSGLSRLAFSGGQRIPTGNVQRQPFIARILRNIKKKGKFSIHSVFTLAPVFLAQGCGMGFISNKGKLLTTLPDNNPELSDSSAAIFSAFILCREKICLSFVWGPLAMWTSTG